jgi:basic membrane lipoprotein Med (substrate-binding protein (PBP1-ABC) superfamily)
MKSKPANVQGLLFKENEAGYLAGTLAALYAKDNNVDTISSVGGQKIPPVDGYIAGYQAGAKKANPQLKTLNAYSQDFVDQAKCKELALSQIERGSKVVFQVAGQCGLGALDAAKQAKAQAIGVDADQSFLGGHILTSAMSRCRTTSSRAARTASSTSSPTASGSARSAPPARSTPPRSTRSRSSWRRARSTCPAPSSKDIDGGHDAP